MVDLGLHFDQLTTKVPKLVSNMMFDLGPDVFNRKNAPTLNTILIKMYKII